MCYFVWVNAMVFLIGVGAVALDQPLPMWWQWWFVSSVLAAEVWVLWKILGWIEMMRRP